MFPKESPSPILIYTIGLPPLSLISRTHKCFKRSPKPPRYTFLIEPASKERLDTKLNLNKTSPTLPWELQERSLGLDLSMDGLGQGKIPRLQLLLLEKVPMQVSKETI